MDCSLPGSSVHGIFQARVLEWGAIAFSEPESTPIQLTTLLFAFPCAYRYCLEQSFCGVVFLF